MLFDRFLSLFRQLNAVRLKRELLAMLRLTCFAFPYGLLDVFTAKLRWDVKMYGLFLIF